MFSNFRHTIRRNLTNSRGWRTQRKIVVIESDDWGSIRMPSKAVYNKLLEHGIPVDKCPYNRYDSLASESDLSKLFGVLHSVEDANNHPAVITANTIIANPDFKKIRDSNFLEYYYELFTDTLGQYPEHEKAFSLWRAGIDSGIFHPQFHGREHLHVNRWMEYLKKGSSETKQAFDLNLFGISTNITSENRGSFLAAHDWEKESDRQFSLNAIEDGLFQFKSLFGYPSLSAISPNYIWNKDIENAMTNNGVRFLQGVAVQGLPEFHRNGKMTIRHHTGQRNQIRQMYLVRNCFFEPSLNSSINWTDRCMSEIRTAFAWKKPAIICSHRVNYIGYIEEENRDTNLRLLSELLTKIVRQWPDVEFMSSDQLGQTIVNNE